MPPKGGGGDKNRSSGAFMVQDRDLHRTPSSATGAKFPARTTEHPRKSTLPEDRLLAMAQRLTERDRGSMYHLLMPKKKKQFERYNTNLEREKDRSQKSLELVATNLDLLPEDLKTALWHDKRVFPETAQQKSRKRERRARISKLLNDNDDAGSGSNDEDEDEDEDGGKRKRRKDGDEDADDDDDEDGDRQDDEEDNDYTFDHYDDGGDNYGDDGGDRDDEPSY